MWMGNVPVCALMLPICLAVTDTLYSCKLNNADSKISHENTAYVINSSDLQVDPIANDQVGGSLSDVETTFTDLNVSVHKNGHSTDLTTIQGESHINITNSDADWQNAHRKEYEHFRKSVCLCVAYVSSIAGISTLPATATNLIFKSIIDQAYAEHNTESPLTFTSWMLFCTPVALVCTFLCWLVLQVYALGWRKCFTCDKTIEAESYKAMEFIKEKYNQLGVIKFSEVAVIIHFAILILLWFFRKPGFIRGWGELIPKGYVTDSGPALAVALSLCVFPSKRPRIFCCMGQHADCQCKPSPALLDWKTVNAKMPWGLLLLAGGSFALAEVSTTSGLTDVVCDWLSSFGVLPTWGISLALNAAVCGMTEIFVNIGTVTITTPLIIKMAENLNLNPLFLGLPAAIVSSFAFMLPIATGTNILVYSLGYLKVMDMVKCGCALNVLCFLVLTAAVNTYGSAIFGWDTPPWNATSAASFVNQTYR